MSKSKVPQIRFKGFSEEWEENKINEKCSISTGKSNTQDKNDDGEYPFYVRSPIIEHSHKYLYDEEAVLTVGDGVGTGKVYHYVNGKYNLHQRVYRIYDFKEIFGQYFYYYFSNNFYSRVMSMTAKTSVDSVRLEMIANMNILYPNLGEQTKIGNYFQQLDKLIEQKEKKYQKLKQFKKAMLNKMFPKNGEDIPEIRFKGFNGKWEEKILDDIINRYDNLRVPISAINRVSGKTPYYGANGIQGYVKGYTHDGEFILVAEDGANDLKNYPIQYVNGKIWVNNHAHVLQSKKDIADNKFLKYAISKINIEPFLVGGGRAKLNANIMMQINIIVPLDINEQIKIGNYFQKLDKQIDLQQKEIEKLKNIKKASLDKMFV
jgi:type I restriction enzyme S subunit